MDNLFMTENRITVYYKNNVDCRCAAALFSIICTNICKHICGLDSNIEYDTDVFESDEEFEKCLHNFKCSLVTLKCVAINEDDLPIRFPISHDGNYDNIIIAIGTEFSNNEVFENSFKNVKYGIYFDTKTSSHKSSISDSHVSIIENRCAAAVMYEYISNCLYSSKLDQTIFYPVLSTKQISYFNDCEVIIYSGTPSVICDIQKYCEESEEVSNGLFDYGEYSRYIALEYALRKYDNAHGLSRSELVYWIELLSAGTSYDDIIEESFLMANIKSIEIKDDLGLYEYKEYDTIDKYILMVNKLYNNKLMFKDFCSIDSINHLYISYAKLSDEKYLYILYSNIHSDIDCYAIAKAIDDTYKLYISGNIHKAFIRSSNIIPISCIGDAILESMTSTPSLVDVVTEYDNKQSLSD